MRKTGDSELPASCILYLKSRPYVGLVIRTKILRLLLFVCYFLAYTYILSLQDVFRSCYYFILFTFVGGKRFLGFFFCKTLRDAAFLPYFSRLSPSWDSHLFFPPPPPHPRIYRAPFSRGFPPLCALNCR